VLPQLIAYREVFRDNSTGSFGAVLLQQEIDGQGFRALYQNLLETQVATVGLRFRF
jgi:hypothetical protein